MKTSNVCLIIITVILSVGGLCALCSKVSDHHDAKVQQDLDDWRFQQDLFGKTYELQQINCNGQKACMDRAGAEFSKAGKSAADTEAYINRHMEDK